MRTKKGLAAIIALVLLAGAVCGGIYWWSTVPKGVTVVKLKMKYDKVSDFYNGLSLVYKYNESGVITEKMGVIDINGNEILPVEYDRNGHFIKGSNLIWLLKDGQGRVFDNAGNRVVPIRYRFVNDSCDDGLIQVKKNNKWGYIDTAGQEVIPAEYDELKNFSKGLASASKKGDKWFYMRDNKWGYIDTAGNIIIPFEYDSVSAFSEDLVLVSKNGKWGFIDPTGKVVIPIELEYDYVSDFKGGHARVEKKANTGLSIGTAKKLFL